MDKLVPFGRKRNERRDAKVDASLQQQLLITWLRESTEETRESSSLLPLCLFHSLPFSPAPSHSHLSEKINGQIKQKCNFNFVIFLMNGCLSEHPCLSSAALRGFDWLVFRQAGWWGGVEERVERGEGERWGGVARLMMRIQQGEGEGAGPLSWQWRWRGDELTYKWQLKRPAAMSPNDTKAIEYVSHLLSGSDQARVAET